MLFLTKAAKSLFLTKMAQTTVPFERHILIIAYIGSTLSCL